MFSYSSNPFVYTFIFLLSVGNRIAFSSSSSPQAQDPKLVVDEVNRYVPYVKKKNMINSHFNFYNNVAL